MKIAKKIAIVFLLTFTMVFLSPCYFVVAAQDYGCAQGYHQDVEEENIPPTETENGYILYRCEGCGREYEKVIFATGHNWSEWVVEKPPTCAATGFKTRTCTLHGTHSETETIPAAGHQYSHTSTQGTCTQGATQTQTCILCGEASTTVLEDKAKNHQYISKVTREADCGKEGEETFTCTACGHSYTKPIPALSHEYAEWDITKQAQAGIEGEQQKQCTNGCGEVITETIEALPIAEAPPPEPEISQEEPPPEAILSEEEILFINMAVTGVDVGLVALFSLLLQGDIRILSWMKKQRIKVDLEEKILEEFYDNKPMV